MVEQKRKGANKISAMPSEILSKLEAGTMESATLSEGLAIDFSKLVASLFPELAAEAEIQIDSKVGITKRMAAVSKLVVDSNGQGIIAKLAAHQSDTVRGWAAYGIAGQANLSLSQKLERLRPLANDTHFGVREWAWLAVRPDIVNAPIEAISILRQWTSDTSEYVRRFASEAIRPRGVWSAHIAELKTEPELALPVLIPLHSDPSRYVQDSVANWLNDAFKSEPQWVIDLCGAWQKQSPTPQTAYIVKRGLRSRKG